MSLQRQRILAIGAGLGLALVSATSSVSAQQATTLQLNQQNNSGISGTATFTPAGNGLRVEIKANGARAGPQPTHIHPGTCSQLDPTPQFTLTSVANGASTTDIQTTMQALVATPHAIHMHKSVDEGSGDVACVDITPGALPRTGEADAQSNVGMTAGVAGLGLAALGLLMQRF